jgi:hypothetical protein
LPKEGKDERKGVVKKVRTVMATYAFGRAKPYIGHAQLLVYCV